MKRVFHGPGQVAFLWLAFTLGGLLLLVACDSGNPAPASTPTVVSTPDALPTDDGSIQGLVTVTPVPSPTGLNETDRVAAYRAIILEMLSKEGKEVTHVYISPYIGQGEHLDNPDQDTPIPPKLLSALKAADKSKTRIYNATDFSEAVNVDTGKVKNGGIFITLGPILNEGDKPDAITARASIFRESSSAEGNIYSLTPDASDTSIWKVLTTVSEWTADQP